MAATASAEIEREIQRALKREIRQLTTRLQRLRNLLTDVTACISHERKQRKKAMKRDHPSDVVRSNQHLRVLQRQYATASLQRHRLSYRMNALRQQAQ